jgi:hypothetical protein
MRMHEPPQFKKVAEVTVHSAAGGAALDGRQYWLSDAGNLCRVEQAAFEKQPRA